MISIEDVVIVGGGLVGCTLACTLGQAGITVVIVDSKDLTVHRKTELADNRGIAIALSSKRLLSSIGLWERISPYAGEIHEIRVTDRGSSFFLHYDCKEVGNEPLGWIVKNTVMHRTMLQYLKMFPSISLITPMNVTDMKRDKRGAYLTLSNGEKIHARLVVAADGRLSPTRASADIGYTCLEYQQKAIVCTVAHQEPHYNVAHERFLPAGPFAILPTVDQYCSSIVWTEHSRLVPSLLSSSDRVFLAELRSRFGDFLGEIEVVSHKSSYPLFLQFSDTYIGQRLALIGDAAHVMHPIAGQGLNMGIRDVAALAEVIIDSFKLGLDIGESGRLLRYQRWRYFDNTVMLALTDTLNRLFSNSVRPIQLFRDIGLAIVNHTPALRQFFMRHAMGTIGDLPRLLRSD